MAHAENLNVQALDEVAQQVGALLGGTADPALLNTQPIELKETFEVWALGLDALAHGVTTGKSLSQLARPTGRRHHQITFAGKAEAFARSSTLPEDGHQKVEELFMSPLATEIDQAIDWIDQNTSGDPLVTLLVVPSYYLHALWLTDKASQSNHILVVDVAGVTAGYAGSALQNLQSRQLLDDQTSLRSLASVPVPIGVLMGGSNRITPTPVSVP